MKIELKNPLENFKMRSTNALRTLEVRSKILTSMKPLTLFTETWKPICLAECVLGHETQLCSLSLLA